MYQSESKFGQSRNTDQHEGALKHWTRPVLKSYAIPKATQAGSGPIEGSGSVASSSI